MTDLQKRKVVLYRLCGYSRTTCFLYLRASDKFRGTQEEFDIFRKSDEFETLRLDALCSVDNWVYKEDAE